MYKQPETFLNLSRNIALRLGYKKKTKKVQRWVEEDLKKDNLSNNKRRSLENAREKTLLKHVLSKNSPEINALKRVDTIIDTVKPEYKEVKINSLYTPQASNEILRLNSVHDNIENALNSKDKITVIRFNGKDIISNGNHRANALLKKGVGSMMVNHYDYDNYINKSNKKGEHNV